MSDRSLEVKSVRRDVRLGKKTSDFSLSCSTLGSGDVPYCSHGASRDGHRRIELRDRFGEIMSRCAREVYEVSGPDEDESQALSRRARQIREVFVDEEDVSASLAGRFSRRNGFARGRPARRRSPLTSPPTSGSVRVAMHADGLSAFMPCCRRPDADRHGLHAA
jgi:hypothetical protein